MINLADSQNGNVREKAKKRMGQGVENFPPPEGKAVAYPPLSSSSIFYPASAEGKARDVVAKKKGIGSDRVVQIFAQGEESRPCGKFSTK